MDSDHEASFVDVLSLGELLIDMFPAEVGRRIWEVTAFQPKPGGAPANVAVAVARLGLKAAFMGKVGEDLFGHFLADVLAREGVDVRGVRFDPEVRTTMAVIGMPDEHSAEFVFYRNPGADTRLQPEELDVDVLRRARVLHFGSLSLTDEPARSATWKAIEIARLGHTLVSYDVNYRPTLWKEPAEAIEQAQALLPKVDLVKVNETELNLLTGSENLDTGSRSLVEKGPALCVVTLGEKGSYFRTARGAEFIPAFRVKTVDAIGCGDSFIAALLTRLVKDGAWCNPHKVLGQQISVDRLYQHLRYANAAGALTSLKRGVIPALPNEKEVEEFLARNGNEP